MLISECFALAAKHSGLIGALKRKTEQVTAGSRLVLLLDTVLGLCVVVSLRWAAAALLPYSELPLESRVANAFSAQLDDLIAWLQALLEWLMGNPAGLKLNRPLNRTLGNFFLYHIYLWRTYMTFVGPGLAVGLRWLGVAGGVGGLSVVGGAAADLCSLLGLHIYCFHVYAARLYQLQMTGLASMWRLFRGKKWNPLRARQDSASFDAEQLFLGTLLFTLLLFLLPTTAVYYAVFSALRLVVFCTQRLLGLCGGAAEGLGGPPSKVCPPKSEAADGDVENVTFRALRDALMGRII